MNFYFLFLKGIDTTNKLYNCTLSSITSSWVKSYSLTLICIYGHLRKTSKKKKKRKRNAPGSESVILLKKTCQETEEKEKNMEKYFVLSTLEYDCTRGHPFTGGGNLILIITQIKTKKVNYIKSPINLI